MRHVRRTPTRSFLLGTGIIIAVLVGVGIPLSFIGTYEQPSWMPRGTGIDIPSPSVNVFRPEMTIVTSAACKATLEPLAEWKTQKGTPCIVTTTEEIYAEYPGRDNAEQIRNYLKDLYVNASLKWVLLAGNESTVPMRYVLNDDFGQLGKTGETSGSNPYNKPTDFYYSDLNGTWDTDGDGNWGERPEIALNGVDEVDWTPEVYVGRFPSSDRSILQTLVEKTLEYEKNPLNDTWMNDFLLGGALADTSPPNDEGIVVQNITNSYVPSSMDVTLCTDTGENLTDGFEPAFNAGKSLVHFQGHGSPTTLANHAGSFYSASSLSNMDKTGLMFAAACSTGAFDLYSNTLMETLLFPARTGVIGYVGALRTDWYLDLVDEDKTNNRLNSLNRGMARYFWKSFFANGLHQPGKALADMKVSYINSTWFQTGWGDLDWEYERKNLFTYTLWGDPEVSIYTAQLRTFKDPLPAVVYNGQRLQEVISYNNSEDVVPNATVCIQSGDFYYTSHMTGGELDVRLALEPCTYTMMITGPNMQPYNRTFTTALDTTSPQVPEVEEVVPVSDRVPVQYTVNDGFIFALSATDNQSGVGAVVLHVSYDNFATYANFSLKQERHTDRFTATLYNFPPGEMQFYYTVMDYAELAINMQPSTGSYYTIIINPLGIHYSIILVGIIAAGVMGIAIRASLVKRWRGWRQIPSRYPEDPSISTGMQKIGDKSLEFV